MPSTTRGSILISTANDIGEALVEKLGGVGYSPNEWKEKYNLCGIAPIDSAPALSVLADSAGTGDERGSILIATADAIGAILNKKYNVLRGFKPKEWASACRKMKALEEGSVVSASIASFSDGADDVPTKSLVVTIPPTLSGVSSVGVAHGGKNLLDTSILKNGSFQTISPQSTHNVVTDGFIPIKGGSDYVYSCTTTTGTNAVYFRFFDSTQTEIENTGVNAYNATSKAFTTPLEAYYMRIMWYQSSTTITPQDIIDRNVMVEVGSAQSTYEPYTTPTQYTASLGRTIYGGTADIVNGEGTDGYIKYVIDGVNNYAVNISGTNFNIMPYGLNIDGTINKWLCDAITTSSTNFGYNSNQGFIFIRQAGWSSLSGVTDVASFNAYCQEHPITLILPLATPTDFTFTGQEIPTRLGVNNFWSDEGDTAVEYYQAPTPYTRKTATGGIANFSDQRTDLPLTKAIANIAPSIAGKSAVNLARAGKNLLPNKTYQRSANTLRLGTDSLDGRLSLKAGTYTLSITSDVVIGTLTYTIGGTSTGITFTSSGTRYYGSFTLSADTDDIFLHVYKSGGITAEDVSDFMLEVGSSASAYVPYQDPTTYTAELGETVYGGSVDFVSGEVQKTWGAPFTWTSGMSGVSVNANGVCYINKSDVVTVNASNQTTLVGCKCSDSSFESRTWAGLQNSSANGCACVYGNGIAIRIAGYTTKEEYETYLSSNPLTFVYMVKEPTESAIPGRVISPIEGVNNYWNDAGGDTEIQYFENEA